MLPLYKDTLLHLSSLPAPAVTAPRRCLPAQLSDDKDSTKTRAITLLIAESFPTEVSRGNFILILRSLALQPEHHCWSHAWLETVVLDPKGHLSYTRKQAL